MIYVYEILSMPSLLHNVFRNTSLIKDNIKLLKPKIHTYWYYLKAITVASICATAFSFEHKQNVTCVFGTACKKENITMKLRVSSCCCCCCNLNRFTTSITSSPLECFVPYLPPSFPYFLLKHHRHLCQIII